MGGSAGLREVEDGLDPQTGGLGPEKAVEERGIRLALPVGFRLGTRRQLYLDEFRLLLSQFFLQALYS